MSKYRSDTRADAALVADDLPEATDLVEAEAAFHNEANKERLAFRGVRRVRQIGDGENTGDDIHAIFSEDFFRTVEADAGAAVERDQSTN